MGRDASIIIQQVKFTYNGTYVCQVKNPPDVHGPSGEIRLRVVTTGLQPQFAGKNNNIKKIKKNKINLTSVQRQIPFGKFLANCEIVVMHPCSCPPMVPPFLQPPSPTSSCWPWRLEAASLLWSSSSSSSCPAGAVRRRGDRGRGTGPRRPLVKRGKTPQCGKSERRERERREEEEEKNGTLPLSLPF